MKILRDRKMRRKIAKTEKKLNLNRMNNIMKIGSKFIFECFN